MVDYSYSRHAYSRSSSIFHLTYFYNRSFCISKRDISFVNHYYFRPGFSLKKFSNVTKESEYYMFLRWFKVTPFLVGKRIAVYNGNQFQSFIVSSVFVGSFLRNFSPTIRPPAVTVTKKVHKKGKK